MSSATVAVRNFGTVSLRCPACRQRGTFHPATEQQTDAYDGPKSRGFANRICPNPACKAHVFVVIRTDTSPYAVVTSYPIEAIEFDSTAVPGKIVKTFEEALLCHQVEADTASAMMIRRTLEELCDDQGATGDNLKERIALLGKKITVPKELIDAADELRLLGNDAAHVEAKDFAEIGTNELEVAIQFTKDLLRSTYQLADLLDRLRGLKAKAKEAAEADIPS